MERSRGRSSAPPPPCILHWGNELATESLGPEGEKEKLRTKMWKQWRHENTQPLKSLLLFITLGLRGKPETLVWWGIIYYYRMEPPLSRGPPVLGSPCPPPGNYSSQCQRLMKAKELFIQKVTQNNDLMWSLKSQSPLKHPQAQTVFPSPLCPVQGTRPQEKK